MNIFVTDLDPKQAARNLCDKHVPKMYLESVQLLCSVHEPGVAPYHRTHYNHPCSVWTRQSLENYIWLMLHTSEISLEYYKRCNATLGWCLNNYKLLNFPKTELTDFALAMPNQYKVPGDPALSYRNYYIGDKARFAKWQKGTEAPEWWQP
jgi:hypothetical protein